MEDNDSNVNDDIHYDEESISSYMRRSPFPLVLITRKSYPSTTINSDSNFSSLPKEKTEAECSKRLSQVGNVIPILLVYCYYIRLQMSLRM